MLEFLIRGVGLGLTYGLLAMPLSLLFVALGTVDFALGSYAVVAAGTAFAVGGAWGIPAGVAASIAAACFIGLISQLVHRRRTGDPLVIVMASLGFAIFLQSLMQTTFGTNAFSRQLFSEYWVVGSIRVSPQSVVNLAVGLGLLVLLWFVLFRTALGRAIRASAANPKGASLVGVPVELVRFAAFVSAGTLSGIAGILYLYTFGLDYASGMDLTLAAFGASILLGIQSPLRGFLGGILIGVVEALSVAYAPTSVATLIPLIFIFFVLIFGRASGQVGARA